MRSLFLFVLFVLFGFLYATPAPAVEIIFSGRRAIVSERFIPRREVVTFAVAPAPCAANLSGLTYNDTFGTVENELDYNPGTVGGIVLERRIRRPGVIIRRPRFELFVP